MISKKDSIPVQVKFFSHISDDNPVYETNWKTIFGLVSDPSGSFYKKNYGGEEEYDKIITVNAGSLSRKINNNTLLLVDNYPTKIYENGDYAVKRKFPEYNGEIVIGLTKLKAVAIPKLYFYNGNYLSYIQINFDKTNLVAYIDKNLDLPFSIGNYLWYRKPSSANQTASRIKLSSKSKVIIGDSYYKYIKLTFSDESANG